MGNIYVLTFSLTGISFLKDELLSLNKNIAKLKGMFIYFIKIRKVKMNINYIFLSERGVATKYTAVRPSPPRHWAIRIANT